MLIGFLLAIQSAERILPLAIGPVAWLGIMIVVIALGGNPAAARCGILLASASILFPRFLSGPPLLRLLLVCFLCVPLAAAIALALSSPPGGFRARLAYLCAWSDTYPLQRQCRRFDLAAFRSFLLAAAVVAASIAVVQVASQSGPIWALRWIAGGIGLLAVAEMATASHTFAGAAVGLVLPPLFRSPHRSTSIAEFWAKRWNIPAAEALRRFCFVPLRPRGPVFAIWTTFAVSAGGHAALAFFVLGRWKAAAACGAFFLLQPILLIAERRMKTRLWKPNARAAWTMTALVTTSPLVIETLVQIAERGWGSQTNVLLSVVAVAGFICAFSGFIATASLIGRQLVPPRLRTPDSVQGCTETATTFPRETPPRMRESRQDETSDRLSPHRPEGSPLASVKHDENSERGLP